MPRKGIFTTAVLGKEMNVKKDEIRHVSLDQ